MDVFDSIKVVNEVGLKVSVSMLDPWYNKGVGGVREDYVEFINTILGSTSAFSEHLYLWGFPEIVSIFCNMIPDGFKLEAWLTWYYKNNPSVIRGWRSSQQACLHFKTPEAPMYPEHFLNDIQKQKQIAGKLRYIPGPTSVIEAALNIGFIGRKEQTGHPAQKPEKVYDKLLNMVCKEGNLVFDPMAGSGTTGSVARKYGINAILADHDENYIQMMEKRLGINRISL